MAQTTIKYPTTEKINVQDNYHGTNIDDPYRWLENDTSAKTNAWVVAQNKVTNSYLNNIPMKAWFKKRIEALMNYEKVGVPTSIGNQLVYAKNSGLQNQSVVYIKDENGKETVLLDPNKLANDGTVALQANEFSKKHTYYAYAISAAGSDWQEIYVMDVKSKTLLKDKIKHVKFTGIVWKGDEGFYYSGYDKPKDEKTKFSAKTEYQKVFFHKIGTDPATDKIVYEDKINPLRYVWPQLTTDERFLIFNISEGTNGAEIKFIDFENEKAGIQTLLAGFKTNAGIIDHYNGKLLLMTNDKASNYKVLAVDPKAPQSTSWQPFIPESTDKLEGIQIIDQKLIATYLHKASSKVIVYNKEGKELHTLSLPGIGTVGGFNGLPTDSVVYYAFTSYNYPTTIFKYNVSKNISTKYFEPKLAFNPADFEVEQVEIPSYDGTAVTMFVIHKKGIKKDGNNPTMLYGYGGFNISLTPSFSTSLIPFLEKGGIYCVANLRGGGEYGEDWHQGGMLNRKQNVFNDFIACAEFLIQKKYTSSSKLAIKGGSNGGLLVGAAMTQRPDLFRVAIPQVGVLDMLRFHKFTVGWGWVVEYGSSDNKEDFNYLIQYSPYHNLKPKTCYPATMITTADHDDRVVPAHSFKFAARLQEYQNCNNPVLIRIDVNAGHGAGKPTSKVIEEQADIWAFTLYNMGIK